MQRAYIIEGPKYKHSLSLSLSFYTHYNMLSLSSMHIYTESSLAIYYNANKQTNETNEIGIKQQKQNI